MDDDARRFDHALIQLERLMDARGPAADVARGAHIAMQLLRQQGIKVKLGGSLAAYLQGAPKVPADVDIELQSSSDFDRAYHTLSSLGNVDGNLSVHPGNRTFHRGMLGVVTLRFQDTRKDVSVDLVNENRPEFNTTMVPPARTGSPAIGIKSPWSLIANYIGRSIEKPRMALEKRDAKQILALLDSLGVDPFTPRGWTEICDVI